MKYLIVSADDLGLAESINRGILKGYAEGIVTSLNVIPSGKAFFDAMSSLKLLKPKEISAHLALTGTSPVTEADKVPTLVAQDGNFHKSYPGFLPRFLFGKVNNDEIYLELRNQLERLKATGITITSLSSHEHIHMLAGILEIFIKLAKEYKISSIRYLHNDRFLYPYNVKKVFKKIILEYFDGKTKRALDKTPIRYTDNFLGFLDSGNIREELLIRMLKDLPDGTTELVAHPGFISAEVLDRCVFHRHCETDLAALTSRRVRKVIDDSHIKLISFSDLANLPKN